MFSAQREVVQVSKLGARHLHAAGQLHAEKTGSTCVLHGQANAEVGGHPDDPNHFGEANATRRSLSHVRRHYAQLNWRRSPTQVTEIALDWYALIVGARGAQG
jgi:hypothetical protein